MKSLPAKLLAILAFWLFYTPLHLCASEAQDVFDADDFRVELPELLVRNVSTTAAVVCLSPEKLNALGDTLTARINGEKKELIFVNDRAEFDVVFDRKEPMSFKIGYFTHVLEINPMPLWLSIVPPLLVIALALSFREVISSLVVGILSGAVIVGYYSTGVTGIFQGFLRLIDKYIIDALSEPSHVSVIVFSTLIGGVVALVSRNGGMQAIVNRISRGASTPKSGQLATWFLGIAIFFDDYANTLVVGNTMRSVTDKLRISREKLAYIVDSTAAPVAAVAFITTWIGAELGYIQGALDEINANATQIESSPYAIFLGSLEYAYYPFYSLIFMLFLILSNRDFGPMLRAERRARAGDVTGQTADSTGIVDFDEFKPVESAPLRMYNAIIPIGIIVLGTIVGLLYTGYDPIVWGNTEWGFGKKLSATIGQSDSYKALLWASMAGLIVALLMTVSQRIQSFNESVNTGIDGFKSMLNAIVVLALAWSLAALTSEMHTADYLAGLAAGNVEPWLIPSATFVVSVLVAFSTGTSWGTMAIVYPIMLPLIWSLSIESGLESSEAMHLFLNTTSCVLAGAVCGDHCSPISDTTILSSLASGCDHIEHVRTQLPYAVTVGVIALVFTTLAAAFDIPWYLAFASGIAGLFVVSRLIGKPVD